MNRRHEIVNVMFEIIFDPLITVLKELRHGSERFEKFSVNFSESFTRDIERVGGIVSSF